MLSIILAAALATNSFAPDRAETAQVETMVRNGVEVEAHALTWLELIDTRQYRESWDRAGPVFQSAVTAEQWSTQVDNIRKPLGTLVSRQIQVFETSTQLPGTAVGNYVVMQFKSDFAQRSDKVETIVMSQLDDEWFVVGYFIR
ncbi:MAG: DUF4019 domain-containing protein [Parerythrobacter sp.]